jgi:hypothetical protein
VVAGKLAELTGGTNSGIAVLHCTHTTQNSKDHKPESFSRFEANDFKRHSKRKCQSRPVISDSSQWPEISLMRKKAGHGGTMNVIQFCVLTILAIACTSPVFAQSVTVGYDRATDFSKFHTYGWSNPEKPAARLFLYDYVVKTIDRDLDSKGLKRIEQDGDLALILAGGLDYGSNSPAGIRIVAIYDGPPPHMNAGMWTGIHPSSASSEPIVAEGNLTLEFVDRSSDQVIWNGTVAQKFDPTRAEESLDLMGKAIMKLLEGFPPKQR